MGPVLSFQLSNVHEVRYGRALGQAGFPREPEGDSDRNFAETVGLERCSGLILTEGWGLGTRPFSTREATGFHKGAGQSDHKDQGFVVARPGLL